MKSRLLLRNYFTLLLQFLLLLLPLLTFGQGVLWGVTEKGGNGVGSIYHVNIDGTNQIVQSNLFFNHKGYAPKSRMTLSSNGKLYGTASKGGEGTNGVVYEFDPVTNLYTKKFDFDALGGTGWAPYGGVTQAPNGKFYGTVYQGPNSSDYGAIFELDLAIGTYTKRYTFTGSGAPQGGYPKTTLLLASNGKFYGTTSAGGVDFKGVLFEYDINTGGYQKKVDFGAMGWKSEDCDLIQAPNGMIYGTAFVVNTGLGFLFEFNPSTGSIAYKANGFMPSNQLAYHNNKIYGVGLSSILEYDVVTGLTATRFTMTNAASQGAGPKGVVVGSNGKLYGTCEAGGLAILAGSNNTNGIIFEFDLSSNTFTKRYSFVDNGTGTNPLGAIIDVGGKIYGVTQDLYSGTGYGKLFSFNYNTGVTTIAVSFGDDSSGKYFTGGLSKTSNGLLLALAKFGGATYNAGCVFAVDATYAPDDYRGSGQITSFGPRIAQTPSTGAFPEGGMTLASNGRLYSITSKGGSYGYGTILETTPGTSGIGSATATANFAVKHHFTSAHSVEGAQCGFSASPNGKLYAMTSIGGANNLGSIYEYSIAGSTVTTVFSFDGTSTGSTPFGSLVQASNGRMYGMTKAGGINSNGVIFEFNPTSGSVIKLFDFNSATTGSAPRGNLIQATNGKLYGMTTEGGVNGVGVLFEYDLSTNTYTKRADFDAATLGANPYGTLYQSPNGNLYGTAYTGGMNNLGTLFEFNPVTNSVTKRLDFNGLNGANPVGSLIYDSYTPASPQAVTFQAIPNKTFGDPAFALVASSSSGLPVSFTITQSSPNNVVSISGNMVTILGSGSATITASQVGNVNYYPAPVVKQSFLVSPISPTVTFTSPSSGMLGNSVSLSVNKGGSTGAVTYSVTSITGNATVSGSTMYLTSVGTITITANVAAQGVYGPAAATQQFTIFGNQPQTINFPSITPTSKCVGTTFTLSATATSGLPVSFLSSNSSIASISGNTVTINAAGNFTITASQSGNSMYEPAASVVQNFTGVAKPVSSIARSSATLCSGSSVTLTANPGDVGNTYVWSTGATTRTISVSTASTFSVVVTNSNGCVSNTASVSTTILSTPATYISTLYDLCTNGYIRLTATNVTGATSYSWSNGATTPYINVSSAGTRTVIVTFSNGCTRTASYTVSPCPNPDPCDPPPVESTAGRTTPCDQQLALQAEKELFIKETSIFPNKANERLVISIPVKAKNNLKVIMYSQTGQQVGYYVLAAETSQLLIDTRALKNGMYMIHIQVPNSKSEVLNRKVMIEH